MYSNISDANEHIEELFVNKIGNVKIGNISGTTNNNGYLETQIEFRDLIFCAVDSSSSGYAIKPVKVNDHWWFYVTGSDNGQIKCFSSTKIFITYYYIDKSYIN